MRNEQFKIQMFRFVDVFPSLTTSRLLTEHIREYFGREQEMPPFMATGAKVAGMLGSFGGAVLKRCSPPTSRRWPASSSWGRPRRRR